MAFNVRLVAVVMSHAIDPFDKLIVDDPNVSVLVPVPEKLKKVSPMVCPLVSNVPVKLPPDISLTVTAVVTVTVPPPELASKVTSSADPGTDAPPAPPEVADQCVVSEASQFPVPPTQYLALILSYRIIGNIHFHF